MADYSDSFDPAHEQEQELLVVQSIFMDEFKRLPDEPASGRSLEEFVEEAEVAEF